MRRSTVWLAYRLAAWLRAHGPMALFLAAVAVVLFGPLAYLDEAWLRHERIGVDEAIYDTLGLFTFQSNRFIYPVSVPLRVVCFLAPTIAASALVGTFFRLVEQRVPLLARRLRGHVVVGGLGNLGSTVARDADHHGQPTVAIERDEEAPGVAPLRAAGSSVLVVGGMRADETLVRARTPWARRVFFTAPSDIVNLDAAFAVRRLARRHGVRPPPKVFAHVYDAGLAETLADELRARDEHEADIVAFNTYRFAAKALVARLLRDRLLSAVRIGDGMCLVRTAWPGDGDAPPVETGASSDALFAEDARRLRLGVRLERIDGGRAADRFAIVGLGRFGRSVLAELLAAAPPGARFLAVERDADACADVVAGLAAADRDRVETFVRDATRADAAVAIRAFAPTTAVVCTDDDLGNLRLAVNLERAHVRTVARMFDLAAGQELSRGLAERGIATVGLARLFRAAIPILVHEQRLGACIDLDVTSTPEVDHLFYLAQLSDEERARLGDRSVPLASMPRADDTPAPPPDRHLVWYRAVRSLATRAP